MKQDNVTTDTYERYSSYIESLYSSKTKLQRKEFVERTGFKDFVPVVDDDAARFLQLILCMNKPMRILEIGTSLGFSTTSMALTAKEYGGRIVTVEFDKKVSNQARKNFRIAGVDEIITIVQGDAKEIIPRFEKESFDMIFQDVDKRLYPVLFEDCVRILKSGGVFIGDDALFPVMELDDRWKDQISPMHNFNELACSSSQLYSTLLNVGDGMMVAVKK